MRGAFAPAGCSWAFEGPARVVVAAGGSVSGSASGVYTESVGPCTGPIVGRRVSIPLSGSKNADRFRVTAPGLSFDLAVRGDTARDSTRQGGTMTWTLELRCETCG
jgi:hypothetical protein